MKQAEFSHEVPRSLAAIRPAPPAGPRGARILAGGQSLVPLLNALTARPTILIQINRAARPGVPKPSLASSAASGATSGSSRRHTARPPSSPRPAEG